MDFFERDDWLARLKQASEEELEELFLGSSLARDVQDKILESIPEDRSDIEFVDAADALSSGFTFHEFEYQFGQNTSLAPDVLDELAKRVNVDAINSVASNPNVSPGTLQWIVDEGKLNQWTIATILDNPNCSSALLKQIANSEDYFSHDDVPKAFSKAPSVTDEIVSELIGNAIQSISTAQDGDWSATTLADNLQFLIDHSSISATSKNRIIELGKKLAARG